MTCRARVCQSCGGFTLVEVLVSTLLMLILLATMLSAFNFQLFAFKRQETQIEAQETARSVLDLMTREVRHAGYDPLCVKTFAAVADARPQRLQVKFDRNGDGVLGANEVVMYAYDSELRQLTRTSAGVTLPLVGDLGATSVSFGYFDGVGSQLTPYWPLGALTASQRAMIRRIRIQRKGPEPRSSLPVNSELASNVNLRNRYLNGNVGCP